MSPTPSRVDIIQAILTNQSLTDQEKTLLIDEFINEIKKEYPDLKYHATKSDLTNLQLELTKEIEETKRDIKELDIKLTKEIKELDVKLTKEISDTRKEITTSKSDTIKWVAGMLFVQVIAITGIFFAAIRLFTPVVTQ